MKNRLLSLALALLLFTAVLPLSAQSVSYGAEIRVPAGGYKTAYVDNSSVYNQSYYNQLSPIQKTVYDALVGIPTYDIEIDIPLLEELTFTSDMFEPSQSELEVIIDAVSNIVQPALNAFLRDEAIVFWLDLSGTAGSTGFGFGYFYDGQEQGTHYWIVDEITIFAVVSDTYKPDTQSFVNAVTDAVDGFVTESSSRYGILKDIHDYLCDTVVYDLNAPYAHEPYGALVDGKAVCEGYAEAFKLLCDRFGIPCAVILGEGVVSSGSEPHMWNYVQMEDGYWYAVDVTWDDRPGEPYYDYFLVGSETVAENFGSVTFSQSHIEDGYFSYGSEMEFVYPVISQTAYQPDPCGEGHTPGEWEIVAEPTETEQGLRVRRCTVCGEITESEIIPVLLPSDPQLKDDSSLTVEEEYLVGLTEHMTVLMVKGEFEGDIIITDKDGNVLQDASIMGTGCIITAGSSTYIVILLGDANGDGVVNSIDYLFIKRAFLGTYTLEEAALRAVCINGAELPTSLDYLMVKRHFLGTYDLYE